MKEPDAPGAADGQREDSKGRSARKLAEWVSLGISAVLILGLAGFLLVEAFRANEPFVPVEVQAKADETRQLNGRFILPVQITNHGEQTLRDLKIELSFTSPDGEPDKTDLLIDYLG
jgi:uncharacterized protein (TIGR02588 family)